MNLADYIVEKYSVEKDWDESAHPRDDHGRFGEGGHDDERAQARRDEQQALRSARASASRNPLTKEKERLSNESEEHLSKELGLARTGDNRPFDLQSGRVAVEVKTLVDQKAGKLTVHPESRARKLELAEKHNLKTYMIAVDKRGSQHRYYAREGIGSYTLKSMKEFTTMAALKRYVR
jgi:hypothetical protein